MTGIGQGSINIQRKTHLKNKIHFYIIKYMHDIINPKYLKRERETNFRFPHKCQKDISFLTLSPAVHMEG